MNINHLLLACVAEREATRGDETLPLLKFLRARVAEEKATVRELLDRFEGSPRYTAGMTDMDKLRAIQDEDAVDWWGEYIHLSISPARVLAECEAKEQILQQWEDAQLLADDDPPDMPALISALTLTLVACAMTLPYAGHPDYQEDWKL